MREPQSNHETLPRTLQAALFVISLVYSLFAEILAGKAAHGLTIRLQMPNAESLLQVLFILFLLWFGFSAFGRVMPDANDTNAPLYLPRRATAAQEWGRGAAIGWGAILLLTLPMMLGGVLYVSFASNLLTWRLTALNLATIAVAALAEEVASRGYPFQRLIRAIGPAWATVIASVVFGALHLNNPNVSMISTLATILAGIVLSVAWLRTHALWVGWGFHFAWNASMGILLGLPISGLTEFSTVVQTTAPRPVWLTGGAYGPERSLLVFPVLIVALIVLIRVTRDYEWNYTHQPIVGAGDEVVVAPPAAHTAMEQAARPAPLVQILSTTPSGFSQTAPPPPVRQTND